MNKNLTVRIDRVMLKKFASVAKYNGRSMNSEIMVFIRNSVINFEKEHGEIEVEPE